MSCWEWLQSRSVAHQVAVKNAAPTTSDEYGTQYRYNNVRPTVTRTLKGTGFTQSEEAAFFAQAQLRHTDPASTITGTDNMGNPFSIKVQTYSSQMIDGTGLYEITITTESTT